MERSVNPLPEEENGIQRLNPLLDRSLKVYSVSEINENIKKLIKASFPPLYIRGEVSNLKIYPRQTYFSLKDESSVINCVLFDNDGKKFRFKLEDGLKIIAFGSLSVLEKRGFYNFIVRDVYPEGKGALQLAFEQLKKKLEKEGLFSREQKKPLPEFPQKIGIITSVQGAVLKDILKIINRRFPNLNILIFPAQVQGEGAAASIVEGIRVFNGFFPVDVLILARGGGSIEDLWPFNEEAVAYAIHESRIPVVSAVGHEIDYTIADFTADLRAPTPSAAAELVVKNRSEVLDDLERHSQSLLNFIEDAVKDRKVDLGYLLEQYRSISRDLLKAKVHNFSLIAQKFIQTASGRFQAETNRFMTLYQGFKNGVLAREVREKNRFTALAGRLALLNPFLILERGYSIVYQWPEGTIVKKSGQVRPGDRLRVRLAKGEIHCSVIEGEKNG